MTHTKPLIPDVPIHPGPNCRPPPNLLDQTCQEVRKVHKVNQVQKILIQILIYDSEGNSPFQEGVISESFQRLDKIFFQDPKELSDFINTGNLIQKFFVKTGRYR